MEYRIERDGLGELKVPAERYWGIHTQRALENFSLSSAKVPWELIRAIVHVKKAACVANRSLGHLEPEKSAAIGTACDEVLSGKFPDEWPIDALQGGAGTSTNMNVNEVLANRANELLGRPKGAYDPVRPIEDVNRHQSTNDVYPTALKLAVILELKQLSDSASKLQGVFQAKEQSFARIVKLGRTELQAAVPMTLGSEFAAFGEAVARDRWRTFKCEERLRVVNLGGTAIGTGLGAPRDYIFLVTEKLRELTGLGLSRAENLVDATANTDAFVEVSGILKAHASNLIKIAEDLRKMALLGEIRLQALQTGSSIMPGKVNPVILEAAIQAGIQVIANDLVVTEAVSRSTFQINEFMPLLAHALLGSLRLLKNADAILAVCVEGAEASAEQCGRYVDHSETIITAFLPQLGYEKAEALLKEYRVAGGGNIRDFLEARLGKDLVAKVLSPQALLSLGYQKNG